MGEVWFLAFIVFWIIKLYKTNSREIDAFGGMGLSYFY